MLARPRSVSRLLPHGPLDLARQIVIFWVAYYAYSLVRGLADDPGVAAAAFDNARGIISLEQTLGLFVEPSVQTWSMGSELLIDGAAWVYLNAQTTVTLAALAWIYLARNQSFYFVRNMFMGALALALVGYMVYPTAPPRFFPEWGFSDSVANFTGIPPTSDGVNAMFNPYAAIPSMHVAFALMIGWPLAKLVRNRYVSAFWWSYPLLVTYVIVATGNHFLMDAILGAMVAGISAVAARELGRVRPAAWQFGPRTAVSSS
jgi:hypothetical protein